ncbi:MAG TPA: hypothetical protein VJ724_00420 [Tahibacter sp.]|nr:hypothetical protein [Tahibacter sp.]
MRCFHLRLQGVFFDVQIEGKSENLGFFTTFAIFAANENAVRAVLERELATRLSDNGVNARNAGLLRSACWIEAYDEYREPPADMPDGFSFYRWRWADLPGMLLSMVRYRGRSHWRSVRLLSLRSSPE